MRRFLFGFLWFVVLWYGPLLLIGVVIGARAGAQIERPLNAPGTFSEGFDKGFGAGKSFGQEFGRKYGALYTFGVLAISVAGSAFGILPGTRRKPATDNKLSD